MMMMMMMMMIQSTRMEVVLTTSDDSATSPATTATPSFKSTQRQLTVMLITICCAAVCLQLPYTTLYLLNAEKWSLWPEHRTTLHAKIYLFMKVADVLATFNYAVNFALYCVSGSAFRHSVRRMCRRQRHLLRHGAKYRATNTKTLTMDPNVIRNNVERVWNDRHECIELNLNVN